MKHGLVSKNPLPQQTVVGREQVSTSNDDSDGDEGFFVAELRHAIVVPDEPPATSDEPVVEAPQLEPIPEPTAVTSGQKDQATPRFARAGVRTERSAPYRFVRSERRSRPSLVLTIVDSSDRSPGESETMPDSRSWPPYPESGIVTKKTDEPGLPILIRRPAAVNDEFDGSRRR